MRRKICVVTGSRSDYGLLSPVLEAIESSNKFRLLLVVTGAHLSYKFGHTVDEIVKDGFKISERINILLSSDASTAIAKSMSVALAGFAKCFKRLKPDILLVMGDRYEILSAVAAAMLMNLPVAHISGGDITEGVIDEYMRHAITKMSHIHFVAVEKHAERVKQMGEEPWRVKLVGEPGLDRIYRMRRLSRTRLEKKLGFRLAKPTVIVTFHPVTLDPEQTSVQINNLLRALDKIKSQTIFTYPNADAGGREIIKKINNFVKTHTRAVIFKSLGSELYLNLLSYADAIIGNSSSAIVEAPSFKLPAVNIGDRQKGRLFPENVICASENEKSISAAIKTALSSAFRRKLSYAKNPYHKGGAARKIAETLSKIAIDSKLLNKKFHDLKK